MTITVTITGTIPSSEGHKDINHVICLPDDCQSIRRVAGRFNPSADEAIDIAKALAAAMIQHADDIQAMVHLDLLGDPKSNLSGIDDQTAAAIRTTDRCAEEARHCAEASCMWGVKAKAAPLNHRD